MDRHLLGVAAIFLVACGSFGTAYPEDAGAKGASSEGKSPGGAPLPAQAPSDPPADASFCAKNAKKPGTILCADFESGGLEETGLEVEDKLGGTVTAIVGAPNRGRVLRALLPSRVADGPDASFYLHYALEPARRGVVYDASFSFYVPSMKYESAGVGMFRFLGSDFAFFTGVGTFREGGELASLFYKGTTLPGAPSRWRNARIRVAAGLVTASSMIEIDGVKVHEEEKQGFDRADYGDLALGVFFTSTPLHPGAAEIYFDDVLVTISSSPPP